MTRRSIASALAGLAAIVLLAKPGTVWSQSPPTLVRGWAHARAAMPWDGVSPPGEAIARDGSDKPAPDSAPVGTGTDAEDAYRLHEPLLIEIDRDSSSGLPTWLEQAGLPDHPRQFQAKTGGPWGSLSALLAVRDPHPPELGADPWGSWQTEQSWRLQLGAPLFLFGQLGAGSPSALEQQLRIMGRTGLGWKVAGIPCGEMVVRGGPTLTCSDPHRPARWQEQSELFLELLYRLPLQGQVKLEYLSLALPAWHAAESDRFNQDLHVAVPFGTKGQLRLGARHHWESLAEPRPWIDRVQLYLGLSLEK